MPALKKLLICIPHLSGREPYLVNAIRGYTERTSGVEWKIELVRDASSAGAGWNQGAEQGLRWFDADYLHFGNDDVVPATGWVEPLVETSDGGNVGCPRIEPAGGHLDEQIFNTHPPYPPPYPSYRNRVAYFYATEEVNQPTEDGEDIDHGNLPFCSREQWEAIGSFLPCHYNTDRWFYKRARDCGFRVLARMNSVFFNYNANIGREKGEWLEQDFLDFDGVVAYPAYERGEVPTTEQHPLRQTAEGLILIREWRRRHLAGKGTDEFQMADLIGKICGTFETDLTLEEI